MVMFGKAKGLVPPGHYSWILPRFLDLLLDLDLDNNSQSLEGYFGNKL